MCTHVYRLAKCRRLLLPTILCSLNLSKRENKKILTEKPSPTDIPFCGNLFTCFMGGKLQRTMIKFLGAEWSLMIDGLNGGHLLVSSNNCTM